MKTLYAILSKYFILETAEWISIDFALDVYSKI
jgi:hypothetical protein